MPTFPSFTKISHHESYPSVSPYRPELSAESKVVLITGAGSGIGRATAVAFAQANARVVVVCGPERKALEETRAEIEALGLNTDVVARILDVRSQDNVDIVFQAVRKHVGPIDIVINGAGHISDPANLKDTTVTSFWNSFEVNVKGAFLLSRAFLQYCSQNDGKERVLILMSSLVAHLPAGHVRIAPASYAISTLAEAKLAEYLASENPDALRAYAIHPGNVETDFGNRSIETAPPEIVESVTWDHIDLPAHFMLWLASPRGAAVPSGKFLWANWDVDELEARSQEMKDDPYLLSMVMGGWPFHK